MRIVRLCLASIALATLAACAEPNKDTEIWDLRADPWLCDNGVDFQFCATYTVVGTDEVAGLYDSIGGLDHQWGHSYRVEVEIIEVENPGADGSSVRYELVELLDEEVHPGLEFELSLQRGSVEFDQDGGAIATAHRFTCTPQQCSDLDALFDEFLFVDAVFRFGSADQLFPLELVSFGVDDG
jgi:hypothetical protein